MLRITGTRPEVSEESLNRIFITYCPYSHTLQQLMSSSILFGHARRGLLATATRLPRSKPTIALKNSAARSLSTNAHAVRSLSSNVNGHEQENPVAWMKILAGVTAAGAVATGIIDDKTAECCGIVGVVGTPDHDAR